MQTAEIPLQKRKGKFVLYIAGALFSTWMLILILIALANDFSWLTAALAGLLLFGVIGIAKGLYDYYTRKNPRLTITSDGATIQFYLAHAAGRSNESDSIVLADMKRFYAVKKRTRFLLKELTFEFEPKSGIFKKNIDVLPALWNINQIGIAEVMRFVAAIAPGIALGYYASPLAGLLSR